MIELPDPKIVTQLAVVSGWSEAIGVGTGVAALVLVVAGAAKLGNITPTRIAVRELGWIVPGQIIRAFGAAEVVGGTLLVLTMWWPLAVLASLGYLGFAAVVWRLMFRATPCGCFGKSDIPPGWGHIGMNLGFAAVCGAAAVVRPEPPISGWRLVLTVVVAALVAVAATRGATALHTARVRWRSAR